MPCACVCVCYKALINKIKKHRRRRQSSSGSSHNNSRGRTSNHSQSRTCQSMPCSSRGRTPPCGSWSITTHRSTRHNPWGGTPDDGSDLPSHDPASLRYSQSRSLSPSQSSPRSPSFHQRDRSNSVHEVNW